MASVYGRTDVVNILISHGGEIHAKDKVSECQEIFYDLEIRNKINIS